MSSREWRMRYRSVVMICRHIVSVLLLLVASPLQAFDASSLTGTMDVGFQPMQSAGIRIGCALHYRVFGQDYAYRKGELVSLAGSISYYANEERTNAVLGLKVGVIDSLDQKWNAEPPYFSYLQSAHGTTASNRFAQFDSPDHPGFRIFVFQLNENVARVLEDIANGHPVTIGFNREKGGLDVLVPLELDVAESTVAADDTISRRRSDTMLLQFFSCVEDVTKQVQNQLEGK